MDVDCAKILLGVLIENSARILRAGFGVNSAEHAFFAVIDLVSEHPALKPELLERIAIALQQSDPGLLNEGMLPRELIELIAHEMRWEEIHTLAEQRVRDKFHGDWSFAISDIAQHILKAESDDWEDREFYQRYHAAIGSG